MTTGYNKEIVQQLLTEGISKQNFDIIDRAIGTDYINYGIPNAKRGPEGFKEIIQVFTNAFPDMQLTLEHIIAEDNYVATRGYWTGTHKGQFMGIGATDNKVTVRYIDFWKLENGKCVENWVQMDFVNLMQQLGVLERELA